MTFPELLPAWFKASASVDFAQLIVGVRPAIRTELLYPKSSEEIKRWARKHGWFASTDVDHFIAISRIPGLNRRLLVIDRELGEHTYRLGLALGYPRCCCKAAARIGESNLDSWEEALSRHQFIGNFKTIDPRNYHEGRSLISHIPCSTRCEKSLKMAKMLCTAKNIIFAPYFSGLRTYILRHCNIFKNKKYL